MDFMLYVFIAGIALFLMVPFLETATQRASSKWIEKIPGPSEKNVAVQMSVEPIDAEGSRWRWVAYFTFDGSGRYPTGAESRYAAGGNVKDEAAAWERARACADDARARYAAEQVRVGKKSSERLPL